MVNSLKYILIFMFSMSLAYALPHNHSPPIQNDIKRAMSAHLTKSNWTHCQILIVVHTRGYALGSIGCEIENYMTVLKRTNGQWRILGLENSVFVPELLTSKYKLPAATANKLFYKFMGAKKPKNLDKDSPLM